MHVVIGSTTSRLEGDWLAAACRDTTDLARVLIRADAGGGLREVQRNDTARSNGWLQLIRCAWRVIQWSVHSSLCTMLLCKAYVQAQPPHTFYICAIDHQ
jgi:hypothetical protein